MSEAVTGYLSHRVPEESAEPVVVLLHGFGASEQSMAGLGPVLTGSPRWVAPRGPLTVNGGGAAWAPITVPGNPDPEHIAIGTERLWAFLDEAVGTTAPLVAVGFSQGGLMASQLLRTRPERIVGTAILAGFTVNAVLPADATLAVKRPHVLYCRGEADSVITPEAVARTSAWLAEHTMCDMRTYPGLGHSIDQRVIDDLNDYLTGVLAGR